MLYLGKYMTSCPTLIKIDLYYIIYLASPLSRPSIIYY